MTYDVALTPTAEADLHRLDSAVAHRVIDKVQWLADNIETSRLEALTGSWPGVFKLRVGDYPESVIREVVGNALVHRDYSIAGVDVTLAIFSNRLEIVSPGDLSHTLTPEKIASGARYARNQTLVNVMRDYGYVDPRGMGIRKKIIPGMRAHNGTEPDLIEEEHRFTVRLWKEPKPS